MKGTRFGSFKRFAAPLLGFSLSVCHFFAALGTEFFVAPNGSPAGDGSLASPWDLQTACDHPANLFPGDTIWMRGGVYRNNNGPTSFDSHLLGTPELAITLRQYPGERAIIDGNIVQHSGGWVNYQGFEIMNTHSNRVTTDSGPFPKAFYLESGGKTNDWAVSGFDLRAPNVKLINLVIHDSIGGGISVSTSATNPELYGILSYYNGWQGCDRSHGHGVYIQSQEPSSATIQDNLFIANYALGVQATGTGEVVDNIFFEGNVAFANSLLARKRQGNFLLGAFAGIARNPIIKNNFFYDPMGSSSDSNIGYSGGTSNAIVSGNYFQTSVQFSDFNEGLTLNSNTFLGNTLFLNRSNYPNNTYTENTPSSNFIAIRTNKYEPGRATVIVYNWENNESVSIDPGSFLNPNTAFTVRSAQNYLGAPILESVHSGGLITLPMNHLPVAKPVGASALRSTSPIFQVFIIQPTEISPDPTFTNTAPSISQVSNLVIYANLRSEQVTFAIADQEFSPEFLNLAVRSSNPKLVPHRNIRIEGNGPIRHLTLLPVTNEIGTAEIFIEVSDGSKHTSISFTVDVIAPPFPPVEDAGSTGEIAILLSGTHVVISVKGTLDAEYEIQGSSDLVHWDYIASVSPDCQGLATFVDSVESETAAHFYRLHDPHD